MFSKIKKIIPASLISYYHFALACLAAFWYRHPSEELIVIGVTGTNGKTTTVALIKAVLSATGARVGATSTALISDGVREHLNDLKMTMPGRFQLQRTLRRMVAQGCRYAVIETSSQGILQSRHRGINYDLAVFTNLTPEHIEAHGGFENYKNAKLELFRHLARSPQKILAGAPVLKSIVVNVDDNSAEDFLAIPIGAENSTLMSETEPVQKWIYTIRGSAKYLGPIPVERQISADRLELTAAGSTFVVGDQTITLALPGRYNVENALAAIAVASALGVALPVAASGLKNFIFMPGRFEFIASSAPFKVLVDYAPEPASLAQLYQALTLIPHKRLIHVLGSAGGGRDLARRPILGEMAGKRAEIVIVTNEDPYDDDPAVIINQVAAGARQVGKKDGQTLFMINDRRVALQKALRLATSGDLVLATGKGCEQAIMIEKGRKIPWDEREQFRTLLSEMGYN